MINKVLKQLSELGKKRAYRVLYNKMKKANPELGKPIVGEQEWLNKWRHYDKHLKPYSYRIFSRYIGPDMDIAPLEVIQNVVEPILTPLNLSEYYSDKNMVAKILPRDLYESCVPRVLLRNISGLFFDEHYHPISVENVDKLILSFQINKVIVKPSRLASGVGVRIFTKTPEGGGHFYMMQNNSICKLLRNSIKRIS